MDFGVFIKCLTYNHARYIKDAMEGFSIQKTHFPYLCVIIDDASTDGEPNVIKDYLSLFFDMSDKAVVRNEETDDYVLTFARHKTNKNCFFAVFLLKYNHHGKKSKSSYFEKFTRGIKYNAICEGDDYWTNPFKLQKQVDYMEENPDCSLCVHLSNWDENGIIEPRGCQVKTSCDLSIEESIRNGGLYIATASYLYRPELVQEQPEWRRVARIGDFPLQILCGLKGRVHIIAENMCVYRFCSIGSWSAQHTSLDIAYSKNEIEWMTLLDESTNHQYSPAIYAFLFRYFRLLFFVRQISFVDYWKNAKKSSEFRRKRLIKDLIKVTLGMK